MTKIDRAALARCIELALAGDDARARQMREKLQSDPWEEVALFAAYGCQMRSLRLRPWEVPPCEVREGESGPGQALLQQLLRAGLSKYEPDPLEALAKKARAH
jgi:hypothetical protein